MQSVLEADEDLRPEGQDEGQAVPAAAPIVAPAPAAPAAPPVEAAGPATQAMPEDVAARVVAWHNRHPLARRIGPQQVQGLGVVALPFLAGARGRWRALFSEAFLPPLPARRVARWAARHAVDLPPLASGWPQRQVELDAQLCSAEDGAAAVRRHVLSAAIEIGEQRLRLLLAPAPATAVLGGRQWSRPRCMVALGIALGLVATGVLVALLLHGQRAPAHAAAPRDGPAVAARAASVAAAAARSDAKPVEEVETVEASTVAAPHGPASAPSAASTVAVAQPRPGRVELAALMPRLPEEERAALRQRGSALRAAQAARAAAAPPAHAFALVTPPLDRRRAQRAATQLQAVAALQQRAMRVEQWRVGAQWRVVFWAFPNGNEAEKARLALADKGLKLQVLEF